MIGWARRDISVLNKSSMELSLLISFTHEASEVVTNLPKVCSTSLVPPRDSNQSRTTSDTNVGVRSSSSVGILKLYINPIICTKEETVFLGISEGKKRSVGVRSPLGS